MMEPLGKLYWTTMAPLTNEFAAMKTLNGGELEGRFPLKPEMIRKCCVHFAEIVHEVGRDDLMNEAYPLHVRLDRHHGERQQHRHA